MKRALCILGVIGLAGLIAFLAVTRHLSQQRAARLDRALMDSEARLVQVETELDAGKARLAQLAKTQTPAPPPTTAPPASPGTVPPASRTAVKSAAPPPAPAAGANEAAAGAGAASSAIYISFAAGVTNLVRIEGTSSVHDWQVEGHLIGGSLEAGPGFPPRPNGEVRPGPIGARANVFIPVRSLKSVEKDGRKYSDAMDEIMYGKLLAETCRRITCTVTSLTLKEPPRDANSPSCLFEATGDLCVAGVTNTITMPVTVLPTADGLIQFSGSTHVKMTDFKIQPPSPSLGGISIKTGDEVTLRFVWWVKRAPAREAAK